MKRLLLSCVMMLLLNIGFAQDTRAVLGVIEDQVVAWNRGDIEGYMQYYQESDSLLFVGKKGPTYGWKNTLNNYKKSYPDKAAMGTLTFNVVRISYINATNAYVLGEWKLKREYDAPGGYSTLWMREIDGNWKIVADHSSN